MGEQTECMEEHNIYTIGGRQIHCEIVLLVPVVWRIISNRPQSFATYLYSHHELGIKFLHQTLPSQNMLPLYFALQINKGSVKF